MLDAEFWIVGKEMGTGLQPATEATGPLSPLF